MTCAKGRPARSVASARESPGLTSVCPVMWHVCGTSWRLAFSWSGPSEGEGMGAAEDVVHVVSRLCVGHDIEMAHLDSSEIVRQRLYVEDDDPKRVALSAWESVVYGPVCGLTWRSMVP
jgi:hypothetical protein